MNTEILKLLKGLLDNKLYKIFVIIIFIISSIYGLMYGVLQLQGKFIENEKNKKEIINLDNDNVQGFKTNPDFNSGREQIIYDTIHSSSIKNDKTDAGILNPKKTKQETIEVEVKKIEKIPIYLFFTVNGNKGVKGETYESGDLIKLKMVKEVPSYYLLIHFDGKKFRPISYTKGGIAVCSNDRELLFPEDFYLDKQKGIETFFIFSSKKEFSTKDLREAFSELSDRLNSSKGIIRSQFHLDENTIPSHLNYNYIHFKHN